jgi:DNA helicase-2/ATP-dependent DNA helicase PcrA
MTGRPTPALTSAALADALRLPPPTDEQAAAIEAPLVPALVVAGAGSGKTETMAARVVYLVANGLARPDQILGLTFTRKAASQLGERIRRRLRTLAAAGVVEPAVAESLAGAEPEVSTYHAFGGRLISEYGPLVGVEPSAAVLTPTSSWQLARRVVGRWDGDLETDLSPDNVTEKLLAISGALADHLTDTGALADELEALLDTLRTAPPTKAQRNPLHSKLVDHVKRLTDRRWILPLVDAFTEAKRAAGVIDFADQMQLAADLVTAHPSIGARLRERFRVVLLDEYQDTGHAQREILRTLFGGGSGHPVTAVGDPVQSIYSWRGAAASNLPRYGTDFSLRDGTPAPRLTLLTSFRNPTAVLDLANVASAQVREADRSGAAVPGLRARPDAPAGQVRHGLFDTVLEEDAWVADAIAAAWADRPEDPPSTAVLLRRRRDMAGIVAALGRHGIPVEVVGLGGLLDEPEVADLVAVLRLLVEPTAGAAALRVLTGARWRISAADLEALARRSRVLAGPRSGAGHHDPLDALRAAVAESVAVEDDLATLVDALADPGPAQGYSAEGYRRLVALAAELQRLRTRLGQPLPDLVADVERTVGLDVEAALAGGEGRAHLDAFADVVADVAATGAGLPELLDYLTTADEREDGLAPAEVDRGTGRVQILTVHAAKGLEWEFVAVPHLCADVFPGSARQTWLGDAAQLPPALRGDRADIPALVLPAGGDQKELGDAVDAHVAELKADQLAEERRLLYVAVTRAERILLFSAHHWPVGTVKPKGPGPFYTELAAAVGVPAEATAAAPADDASNPLTAVPRTANWPVDPLGGRRPEVTAGAAQVRTAIDRMAGRLFDDVLPDDPFGWERDVSALLAERAAAAAPVIDVDLPGSLSVSALVDLADDPEALARRIRRPIPTAPAPQARRGTAFHAWLEHRYGLSPLLDLDELPGSADADAAPDPDLSRLQDAFLASSWADRVPMEVEVPFATRVAGLGLRGRIDAIFSDPDGGCTVIDWKTGRLPAPERRAAVAVQLAAYRLAWSRLSGLPLDRVRAAFHYVGDNLTLAPVDLLDADGLAELVADATVAAPVGAGR